MIYKNDLIRLGFQKENQLGHDYLAYSLDLDLRLVAALDDEENLPLTVEFEPPQINISFTDEDDVKSLIQIIERNK
jgi:hypothetical protein